MFAGIRVQNGSGRHVCLCLIWFQSLQTIVNLPHSYVCVGKKNGASAQVIRYDTLTHQDLLDHFSFSPQRYLTHEL